MEKSLGVRFPDYVGFINMQDWWGRGHSTEYITHGEEEEGRSASDKSSYTAIPLI